MHDDDRAPTVRVQYSYWMTFFNSCTVRYWIYPKNGGLAGYIRKVVRMRACCTVRKFHIRKVAYVLKI